jgi:hypothetical protein
MSAPLSPSWSATRSPRLIAGFRTVSSIVARSWSRRRWHREIQDWRRATAQEARSLATDRRSRESSSVYDTRCLIILLRRENDGRLRRSNPLTRKITRCTMLPTWPTVTVALAAPEPE